MPRKEILDRTRKYIRPYCITKGEGFPLKNSDPGDTCGLKLGKGEASKLLQQGTKWLAEEQEMLYAQDRWSLLLVFQAMDAAGKDSTIEHVMSGVNPQGCQVFSFKQPSQEDLKHDFLWRYFKVPRSLVGKRIRDERLGDIALRGLHHPAGSHYPQIPPAPVTRGTEKTLYETLRQAGKELEVLCFGRAGTPVLRRLHARLRRSYSRHGIEARPVVRGAGR